MSKQQIQSILEEANKIRVNLSRINSEMREHLDFMEYKIKKQLSIFAFLSLCGGDRSKFLLPTRFVAGFNSMTLLQRANFYKKTVIFVDVFLKQQSQKKDRDSQNLLKSHQNFNKNAYKIQKQKHTLQLLINQGFRSWSQKQVIIHGYQAKISSNLKINLRHYILRKSKKKQRLCYVFESICKQNPDVIRIAFKKGEDPEKNTKIIKNIMEHCHYLLVSKIMAKVQSDNQFKLKKQSMINSNKSNPKIKSARSLNAIKTELSQNQSINDQQDKKFVTGSKIYTSKSIVQQILKDQNHRSIVDDDLPDIIDQQNEKQKVQDIDMLKSNHKIINNITKQQFLKDVPRIQSTNTIKMCKDIFSLILPQYNLKSLTDLTNYKTIINNHNKHLYIYQHCQNSHIFKMEFMVKIDPQIIVKALYNVQLYKIWHGQVIQGQMKMLISTENTAIMYQKHKRYNEWYKQRDFVYIRHVFKTEKDYFMVDKSIQNNNFMPFNSIVRGKVNYAVWKIARNAENGSTITIQLDLQHQGLTKSYRQQLTKRYLQGFQKLQNYYINLSNQNKLKEYLSLNWQVNIGSKYQQNFIQPPPLRSIYTADFQGQSQISENQLHQQTNQEEVFFTCQDISSQDQEFQINKRQIQQKQILQKSNSFKFQEQQIDLDQEGLVILPKSYLTYKHPMLPTSQKKFEKIVPQFKDIVLKEDWALQQNGGLKLINKKKIQAQSNVMNHMMKTLKKNILTGKGLSGISIPVQVFSQDSQLQRFGLGMSLAPQIFQKSIIQFKDPLSRFKSCLIFGLSHSILSLDIQKPFNPILGQTYQGQIAGCPIYGQQISHHPPISSMLFYGRGYKIYGSLQVKGDLGMNSATCINQGFLTIEFLDNNQKVYFQSQYGELSGLRSQQKFCFKGKAFYYDPINLLFCQMKFQQSLGYFSKPTWQYTDMIQGQITKISEDFLQKFLQAENKNKPSLNKKDITQSICKISGRWPKQLKINGKIVYQVNDILPYEMKDYAFPLNSNSNYRQDIVYRKKVDIARCQIEKDRLQNIQRNDKKLRTKKNK